MFTIMKDAVFLLVWWSVVGACAEERPAASSIYEDIPGILRNLPEVSLFKNAGDPWSPLTLKIPSGKMAAIPSEFGGLRIDDGQVTITCSESSRIITFGRLSEGVIVADLRWTNSGIRFSLITWDGAKYRLKQTYFYVWKYIQGGEDHSKYAHFIVAINDSPQSTKEDVTKIFSVYESALGRYEVPVTFRMGTSDIVIGLPVFADKTIRYRNEK